MDYLLIIYALIIILTISTKSVSLEKDWTKKDVRDYNDADLERLYEQWEKDEEPLPDDELPEHMRKQPQIDMSKLDFSDPENVLRVSKKGKTLMMFVSIVGNPTRQETESLTSIWQASLQNSHLIAERFIVSDDRVIFMFKDGSQAWEAKDYLVKQDKVKDVTIESKVYPGKGSGGKRDEL